MKKSLFTLLLIAFVGYFMILKPDIASAQGYGTCTWNGPEFGGYCQVGSVNCDPNCFAPASACVGIQFSSCPGATFVCGNCFVPPTSAPPPPSNLDFNSLYSAIGFRFGGSTVGNIISVANTYLFPIAGLILLLYLIYGGLNLMLSGGDPKKAAAAKSIISTAIMGIIIIFAAYWIVQLVGRILGLTQISLTF